MNEDLHVEIGDLISYTTDNKFLVLSHKFLKHEPALFQNQYKIYSIQEERIILVWSFPTAYWRKVSLPNEVRIA